MSDCNLQASGDGYQENMNSMGSNKSIWMDRWMTNSSKILDVDQGEMGGQSSKHSNQKRLDINAAPCNISEYRNSWRYQGEDMAVATRVPHSTAGVEVLAESNRVEITYETLAMNSRSLRGTRLESEPVSVFKFSEKMGRILAQKRLAVSIEHESITQTDGISKLGYTIEPSSFRFLSEALRSTPTERAFQFREFHSLPGGGSKCQEQLAKPFLSLDKVRVSGSNLFEGKVAGSSSNSLPYVFESRELQSSVCRKEKIDQSSSQVATLEHIKRVSPTHAEHKNHNHRGNSSDLVCDKQIDSYQAGSRNYDQSSYSWKKDATLKLNDLSSSHFSFSESHGKPRKRKDDFTSAENLPSQSCPRQLRRLKELYSGCHSSSDVRQPVHHNDELGVFSTVDSVEGLSKEPWISQTTNHRSVRDISDEAPDLHYLSESASHKRFTLLSDFDCHKERSEKLQPLRSPRNSERKIGLNDVWTSVLASNNESSAETDTMDINVCRTLSSFPSITSSTSYKDNMVVENSAKSAKMLRVTLGSMLETELPDINEAPPSSLSPENRDFSTSRTESLDAEHLHFDQAGNSSSSMPLRLSPRPDPSSRWVKRLKVSLPGDAHGTKNVKLEDSSFTAKIDELYNKMSDLDKTNLTTAFDEPRGEADRMELDRTALLLGKKPASMPSSKESWDIKLSHPWIQRWCHNQALHQPMSTVAPVSPEVDCSKTASDGCQIKEFPSIAAMALMGKAMSGLQACNFQNKGSFIVWGKRRQAEKSCKGDVHCSAERESVWRYKRTIMNGKTAFNRT